MASFEAKISPLLVTLSHELLDKQSYSFVESLSNFLVALHSGRWRQLPTDEQIFWLKRLHDLLMGRDSIADVFEYTHHQPLIDCAVIVAAEQKGLERLL